MDRPRVVVVGSANMDLIFRSPRIPLPGETLIGSGYSKMPGGKGANQAVAIARLGGRVEYVGKLGSDDFGAELFQSMERAGVGVGYATQSEQADTGMAAITVAEDGQNTIVVLPGANAHLSLKEVAAALSALQPAVILAQLEVPLDCLEFSTASLFILNPAPACKIPESILRRVDVITPNETEMELLTGIRPSDTPSCQEAANRLIEQGVREVIVTLGERGCCWIRPHSIQHFPPLPVHAIDTTGAGDAFNGALAHFIAEGRPIADAIKVANAVGALSTTRRGAQDSMPSLGELKAFAPNLF